MARRIPEQFKHTLFGLVNRPYVTRRLSRAERPLIVHISDTPRLSYPFIYRIMRVLEPDYLIHTGDIVDDIKLEMRPQELGAYKRELGAFLSRLEQTPVGGIFFVPGNHDDSPALGELSRRSVIVSERTVLRLAGLRIAVSHIYQDDVDIGDFYLYGHTPLPDHHRKGEMVCLNGVSTITVIEAPSKRLHLLPYPAGTDSVRKLLLPKPGL